MKAKVVFHVLWIVSISITFFNQSSEAQLILGTSPYIQNFNSMASGLPAGWTVRTGASVSVLGTTSTLVTNATAWNSTTGNYRNVAAALGLSVSSSSTSQNNSTDRALAVRQTGSLGDPGAAFVLQLDNTVGLYDFSLSFKLQSLDGSSTGRTVTWKVDYGFGNIPTSFIPIATNPSVLTTTLSSASWGSTDVTANFGNALDNNSNSVWIRIVTLTTATGSSSRPTSAIDDFQLSYSTDDVTPPTFISGYPNASNITASGFDLLTQLNEPGKTYFVTIENGLPAPTSIQVKAGQEGSGNVLNSNLIGSIDVIAAQLEFSVTVEGLSPNTTYDVYMSAEDQEHNLQGSPSKVTVSTGSLSTKTHQTIMFDALGGRTFGDAPFDLAATSSSGLKVDYNCSDPTIVSVVGKTVTILKSGAVVITASQGGNEDFDPAAEVIQTLTINKANQIITFNSLSNSSFGDMPFDLIALGGGSSMPVTFISSKASVATIVGSTLTIIGPGTSKITASQVGNVNYNAAIDAVQTLTVSKASQSITFGALSPMTFGDGSFNLIATGGPSGLPVTFTSSKPSVATVSGNTVTIIGAGTATITAKQTSNVNYSAAVDGIQVLTINKAGQSINFNPLAQKTFGDGPIGLTATGGASGLPVTFASSSTSIATVSGATLSIVGAGIVTIIAKQSGNSNYNTAFDVSQTLTVAKASQIITFNPLPEKNFGEPSFNLTAKGGGSGLPVIFASSNGSVATISNSSANISGAGSTTITASQAGNSNYSPAGNVTQILTVNKANQTILFSPVTDKIFDDPSFSMSATASSGLAINYTTTSNKIIITGNQIAILKAGRTTIMASQPGNASFNPAISVEQDFCIKPPKPIITLSGILETPILTSSFSSGNQWYLNGIPLDESFNSTLIIGDNGIYRVRVREDDCLSDFSEDMSIVVTEYLTATNDKVKAYPNPVTNYLRISGLEDLEDVQVFNISGGVSLIELEKEGESYWMNVEHLSKGVYLLSVTDGKGIHQFKFVKK